MDPRVDGDDDEVTVVSHSRAGKRDMTRKARSVVSVFLLRIASVAIGFGISLLLARLLGASGYGTYSWCLSVATLVAAPATLGIEKLLVREIAAFHATQAWSLLRGIVRWSNLVVSASAVVVALISSVVAVRFAERAADGSTRVVIVALAMVPLLALTRVRTGILRGLRRVGLSETPEQLLRPFALLSMLTIAAVYGADLTPLDAIWLALIATAVAFVVGSLMLGRRLPSECAEVRPTYRSRVWMAAGLPLVLWTMMSATEHHMDVLMLGAMAGPTASGTFAAADKIATTLMYVPYAVNVVLGPEYARLHIQARSADFQRLLTRSSRLTFALVLAGAAVLIVAGKWLLGLFGSTFIVAYAALVVLCIDRICDGFAATVGGALVMTGNERVVARAVGLGAVVNIVANYLLIPRYGALGAALATLASTVVARVDMIVTLYRRTGLKATGFPGIFPA
jgi:O-antigen/teichoic acid export membrane protein